MSTQLSYVPLSSSVNPGFWNKLSELKLNVYKLDEKEIDIWGYYTILRTPATFIEVDSTSFNSNFNNQALYVPFHGTLLNTNTIEQFKEYDKMQLINREGQGLFEKMKDGTVLKNPSLLNSFLILSYADLKKYHYYYWFAFPVPKSLTVERLSCSVMTDQFTQDEAKYLYTELKKLDCNQKSYFLVTQTEGQLEIHTLDSKLNSITSQNAKDFYFAFLNISHRPDEVGSQLRNYILFILLSCAFLQNKPVNFLSISLSREGSAVTCKESYFFKLRLPVLGPDSTSVWVGWEKNERGKAGPRLADMKSSLDPAVNAENAVDLNLKLMKWNLLPNVDLEKIKTTKFLLLGSGTLGCSVARTLLGWGVRHFTFVDNSTVSFSNPVRQSLFNYQDSVEMKPKALAAADNLRLVFPGVNSKGVQLTIPMPGHTVGESMLQQTRESVGQLEKLINENDVVFLLMDSRESRWLPTLIGSMLKKIVVNAALGFDSYLIMRHGIHGESQSEIPELRHPSGLRGISGANLGCYFCNDVTAPGNTLNGRTLDQQCTVTRPGVSQVAGALAAELAISLIQHQDGVNTPAVYSSTIQNLSGTANSDSIDNESLLGVVPHSIRGFLHSFEQILPTTKKYTHCVACSDFVVQEYKKRGVEFLLKVFNSSKHLEDVARLTEMFQDTNFGEVLEFSDEDF